MEPYTQPRTPDVPRVGYACLLANRFDTRMRTLRMAGATPHKLTEVITHNLDALERMIAYNEAEGIRLFRISSDLIPLATAPVAHIDWADALRDRFVRIGRRIRAARMRVTMHPGQYSVLSSPDADVVRRTLDDLHYHAKVLDLLGTGPASKIILHGGGTYGERRAAMRRFVSHLGHLDASARARLVVENDERSYHIGHILALGAQAALPVVFDNLHHALFAPSDARTPVDWIRLAKDTWREGDGPQKIHYSEQAAGERPGRHSQTVDAARFMEFVQSLEDETPDIMLEVKDKNVSQAKCALCLSAQPARLAREWRRYDEAQEERGVCLHPDDSDPAAAFGALDGLLARPVLPLNRIRVLRRIFTELEDAMPAAQATRIGRRLLNAGGDAQELGRIRMSLLRIATAVQHEPSMDSYRFVDFERRG